MGSEATYAVPNDDRQAEDLLAGRTPAEQGSSWGRVPEERWGRRYEGGIGEPVPTEPGSWPTFYSTFADALRGSSPVPVDPWDAVAALEVLDAARVSADRRRVVGVPA